MAAESNPLWQTLVGAAIGFVSAIFAEPVRRWLYQPRLELAFGDNPEYKARTPEQAQLFDPSGNMGVKPREYGCQTYTFDRTGKN
jgi:hypothetical protein